MKISKDAYMLAKQVYHNFFTLAARGYKAGTTPADIYRDYSNADRRNIGRHLVATLRRCARIIREYEAQNISHRISSDTIVSIDPATGEGVIMQRINPTCNSEPQKAIISQPPIKYVGDIKNLKK